MTPRRLDKPTVTAASTAYADKLKQRTTAHKANTSTPTLITKPPRYNKFQPVDVTFKENDFPPLKETKTKSKQTNQQKTTATTTLKTTTTATINETPFDYKAELNRLSEEIEHSLKKQFEALFSTMEQKIDDLAKQNEHYRQEQKLRFEDQEIVNATVTKQLTYLVDNMKNILKYATPNTPLAHPLPTGNGMS